MVNPFGGLNFVIKEFENLGIGDLLEADLPALSPLCTYKWKDLLYSFCSIYFCSCSRTLIEIALDSMPSLQVHVCHLPLSGQTRAIL